MKNFGSKLFQKLEFYEEIKIYQGTPVSGISNSGIPSPSGYSSNHNALLLPNYQE
jgi:hypothetical protein